MSGSLDHSYPFLSIVRSLSPALKGCRRWSLFFGVIQAYVFAVLSLVYISSAAALVMNPGVYSRRAKNLEPPHE